MHILNVIIIFSLIRFPENPNLSRYWASVGFGFAEAGSFEASEGQGINAVFSLSYNREEKVCSLRLASISEFQLGIFQPLKIPSENIWDIGVLLGKNEKIKYGFLCFSVGVSVIGGIKRGKLLYKKTSIWGGKEYYEKIEFMNIGIPVEFQIFFTPSKFAGLGIYGFGNFNPEGSFLGLSLSFIIGKIR